MSRRTRHVVALVALVAFVSPFVALGGRRVASGLRLRRALMAPDQAIAILGEDGLREHADALARALLPEARDPGRRASRALLAHLWSRNFLTPEQRAELLNAVVRVSFDEPARNRFPEKEPGSVAVTVEHLDVGEEGLAGVPVLAKILLNGLELGHPSLRDGAFRSAGSFRHYADLTRYRSVGRYRLEARLELHTMHGITLMEAPNPRDVEIVSGDWRAAVTLDTKPATDALVRDAIDVTFGSLESPERDLLVTAASSRVELGVVARKSLGCWLGHSITTDFEDGETRRLTGPTLVQVSPGEPGRVTVVEPVLARLTPGRYPLRIRLRPEPSWLLQWATVNELTLFGNELVFDRTLVVE